MPSNSHWTRRDFVGGLTAGALCTAATGEAQTSSAPPIVDCHIHLFDQTRPQGAPYSGGGVNAEPALPARYRRLATPLGIVAAIEIDASNWVEDNLWVLETIEKDPLMVGTAGNLQPEKPDFKDFLERFHKNKLFLGFRYGNIWGYNLVAQVNNPVFIEGMKLTAQAGLTMDSANPQPDLVAALVRLKDKVPDLRMVLDHTAHLAPGEPPSPNRAPIGAAERKEMEGHLRDLAHRPGVYFKLSEILQMDAAGAPITDAAVYKPRLDYLMDLFGEDRVIFGSDWPNDNAVNHLDVIVKIVRGYFGTKSRAAQEKYFWRNSIPAYGWIRRDATQPQA